MIIKKEIIIDILSLTRAPQCNSYTNELNEYKTQLNIFTEYISYADRCL